MNGLVIKIACLILGLGASFLALSCAQSSPNTNQNQNAANAYKDNVNIAFRLPVRDPTCDVPNLAARRNAVEGKINTIIDGAEHLRRMFRGHNGKEHRLELVVGAVEGSTRGFLEVRLKGDLTRSEQLVMLAEKLQDFMFEGCVQRVVFGTSSDSRSITSINPGFEWHYCDYPNVACPDGECRENCNLLNHNSNGNSITNANGNANSTVNSNANRPSGNNGP